MDDDELILMLKQMMAFVVLDEDPVGDPVPTLIVDDQALEMMARVALSIVRAAHGIVT